MIRAGFIYCLINPCLPGIVKVGRTVRDTNKRAGELWREYGTEHPFTVLSKHAVSDCVAVEALAHKLLARYRVPRSELFECTPQIAQAAIHRAARMILWSPWYLRLWHWLILPRPQRASNACVGRGTSDKKTRLCLFRVVVATLIIGALYRYRDEIPGWLPEAIQHTASRMEIWQ